MAGNPVCVAGLKLKPGVAMRGLEGARLKVALGYVDADDDGVPQQVDAVGRDEADRDAPRRGIVKTGAAGVVAAPAVVRMCRR